MLVELSPVLHSAQRKHDWWKVLPPPTTFSASYTVVLQEPHFCEAPGAPNATAPGRWMARLGAKLLLLDTAGGGDEAAEAAAGGEGEAAAPPVGLPQPPQNLPP